MAVDDALAQPDGMRVRLALAVEEPGSGNRHGRRGRPLGRIRQPRLELEPAQHLELLDLDRVELREVRAQPLGVGRLDVEAQPVQAAVLETVVAEAEAAPGLPPEPQGLWGRESAQSLQSPRRTLADDLEVEDLVAQPQRAVSAAGPALVGVDVDRLDDRPRRRPRRSLRPERGDDGERQPADESANAPSRDRVAAPAADQDR